MIDFTNTAQVSKRREQHMNAKNGHTNMWDTLINDTALMRDLSFEDFLDPRVETMLSFYKLAVEDMPHQRSVAAALGGSPSLEWLVRERRRQFASLSLQYAMLPADQKDEFANGLIEWWRLVRANEDRADAHLEEHRRRAQA